MWQNSGAISDILFHKEPKKLILVFTIRDPWLSSLPARSFLFKFS
jgi:hypothetical protein